MTITAINALQPSGLERDKPIQPGDRINDIHGTARVMAVAEGYLMARRPGCKPFVLHKSDIGRAWRLEIAS